MPNVRVCQWCGKVLEGAYKGKHVAWPADPMHHPKDVPTEYRGMHISHGACDPPCRQNEMAADLARRKKLHKK